MASKFSILIVSSRLPKPVGKGDGMTIYHMVRFLAEQGHRIHLVAFSGVESWMQGTKGELIDELHQLCETVDLVPFNHNISRLKALRGFISREPLQVWYFRYREMQQTVARVVEQYKPDVLYTHHFRMAQYVAPFTGYRKVIGLQISYTLNYQRMRRFLKSPFKRMFYALEEERMKRFEPSVLEAFDRVLLISPHDKAAIEGHREFNNVFFNPHGHNIAFFGIDLGQMKVPNSLILSGDFSYPPNTDAALFFYEKIYPLVLRQVPDAQLWLVGREPPAAIRALDRDESVLVTGWVDDLRLYLQRAEVAIVPMRIAAGMQNKVVISMAAGLPVVATEAANEGIRARAGDEILLADPPEAFADAIVGLLNNPAERERISAKAKRFVQMYWTWEYHFAQLEQMLQQLIENGTEAEIEQYIFEQPRLVS